MGDSKWPHSKEAYFIFWQLLIYYNNLLHYSKLALCISCKILKPTGRGLRLLQLLFLQYLASESR